MWDGCRKELCQSIYRGLVPKEQTILMPSLCEKQRLGLLIILLKDSPRDTRTRQGYHSRLVKCKGWGFESPVTRQECLRASSQQELTWLTWAPVPVGPHNSILSHSQLLCLPCLPQTQLVLSMSNSSCTYGYVPF